MKKEIRFSSIIDTREFDRAVEQMQKKLQDVYIASDRSRSQLEVKQMAYRAGLGSAPTLQDKIKAEQDDRRIRKAMDDFIKEQVKQHEELGKKLAKQLEVREKLLKLAKDTAEIDKQILKTQKEMADTQGSIMVAMENRKRPGYDGEGGYFGALQRGVSEYMLAKEGGAGFGGRLAAGLRGFRSGVAGMGTLAVAGGALTSLGAAAQFTGNFLERINLADRNVIAAQGSASATLGSTASNILRGQGFDDIFFASEKAEAMKRAEQEITRTKRNDLIKFAGLALATIGLAALTVTSFGSALAIPVLTTALGTKLGVAGGVLAGAGLLKTGSDLVGNITDRMTGSYDAQLLNQKIEAQQQYYEALKNLNPVRKDVMQRYQQEVITNLNLQRALGINDEQLKQFYQLGGNEFPMELMRNASSAILAAGGSTSAAFNSSRIANAFQREFDLTNAPSILGRLSGLTPKRNIYAMGYAPYENAVKRMLAQAEDIGITGAEEKRQFGELATQAIVDAQAVGETAQNRVTDLFSKFVSGGEMFRVKSAKPVYDMVMAAQSATSGPSAAIEAAYMSRDPILSKLNKNERLLLMELSSANIVSGNPLIRAMAAKAGVSEEEFINAALKSKKNKTIIDSRAEDALKRMKELAGKTDEESLKQYDQAALEFATIQNLYREEASRSFKLAGGVDNYLNYYLNDQASPDFSKQEKEITSKILAETNMQQGGARAGDQYLAGKAAQDQAYLEALPLFAAEISRTQEGLVLFSKEVIRLAGELKNVDLKDIEKINEISKKFAEMYAVIAQTPQGRQLLNDQQTKGAPKQE